MFVHFFFSLLMGFLLVFPCAGYAQRILPTVKYVPQATSKVIQARSLPTVCVRWFLGCQVPSAAAYPRPAFKFAPLPVGIERSLTSIILSNPERMPHYATRHVFPGKADIDAVIFDLDGTLLDSLGAWEHSGSNFVRTQGFEPPASLDEELVSMSLLDGAKLIKNRYRLPQSPEEILALTLRPIRQHYYTDILPMPGVPETLARLKAQGVKMAVATASDKELAEVSLRRLGLLGYFEFIITCDEVGVGKSSPKVYEEALRRLGTSKARTLVAEDALHALQTAHAAGFPTAAIEEAHSASQQAAKKQAATYYVLSYEGKQVFKK